jgi:hypothetical protein
LAGTPACPKSAHQIAEAAVAVAEWLRHVRQRLLRHKDRPQGFVLPMQGLRRVEEEVLNGGVVHGEPPGIVTDFSSQPSSDDIFRAQLQDKGFGAEVAEKSGNLGLRP